MALALLVAVALAGAGFGIAKWTSSDSKPSSAATPSNPTASSVKAVVNGSNTDEPIAAVAAAVSPSVVQIETREGLGSGVVYDDQGHIMTAAHVVDGAGKSVNVRLADGTEAKGTVIGADDASDIAVVQVSGAKVTPATLAVGVQLLVGQTAVAVGSPFGLDQTVTAGIVSAIGRAEQTPGGAVEMIQTDAPINPGNSGGPLADKQGRVIGINDQIASTTGENSGLGFAIPIDLGKAVADKLVSGQPVEFAILGVDTAPQGQSDGATVAQVEPGSAADKAGLQEGDRITAIDGQPVRDDVDLKAKIRAHQPGDTVTLTVHRQGQDTSVQATLGSTKGG